MLAYALTAVTMLERGGLPKLWLTFGAGLLAIILSGFAVSRTFAVPNATRLMLFVIGLGGSTLLCTTVFLHFGQRFRWGQSARALAAMAGCIVGVITGMLLVIYGLRTW